MGAENKAFDNDEHEAAVAARYEQLAKVAAFDYLVDMALDGQITMDAAISQFKTEQAAGVEYGTAAG